MSEQAMVTTSGVAQDIEVMAESQDEMALANKALILWCKSKIELTKAEATELKVSAEHAKKQHWSSGALERHAKLAARRVEFYEKMLVALEHGYQIVPNFPVSLFAIRTGRDKPLKLATPCRWARLEQSPEGLPEGEGDYKNPFPEIWQRTLEPAKEGKSAVVEYYAKTWKDLEFPLTMAKPKMMEATTTAMALKIFDDIGILPQERAKGDPCIVARIQVPSWNKYDRKWVTFIIGWLLNTKDL